MRETGRARSSKKFCFQKGKTLFDLTGNIWGYFWLVCQTCSLSKRSIRRGTHYRRRTKNSDKTVNQSVLSHLQSLYNIIILWYSRVSVWREIKAMIIRLSVGPGAKEEILLSHHFHDVPFQIGIPPSFLQFPSSSQTSEDPYTSRNVSWSVSSSLAIMSIFLYFIYRGWCRKYAPASVKGSLSSKVQFTQEHYYPS